MKIFKIIVSIIFAVLGILVLNNKLAFSTMQLFIIPIGLFSSSYAGMNLGDFVSRATRPEVVYYYNSSDFLYLKLKYFIGLILKGGILGGAVIPYFYFFILNANNLARIIFTVVSVILAFISHILIIAIDDKRE